MTETTDRPLVTFALFAYNQEQYIREAVEGAFAQTYEPLEIILSDDCSTDRTFEIMQEMAAAYEGPHQVRVRQSKRNLGITGHVTEVAREAKGAILVMAAGDDISEPERTIALIQLFEADSSVLATFSDFSVIGKRGPATRTYHDKTLFPPVTEILVAGGGVQKGATYAYRVECFFWPDVMPDWLLSEDRILPFRASLLGTVAYCARPLVRYRSPGEREKPYRPRAIDNPQHPKLLAKHLKQAFREGRLSRLSYFKHRLILMNVALVTRIQKAPHLRPAERVLALPTRLARHLAIRTSQKKYDT